MNVPYILGQIGMWKCGKLKVYFCTNQLLEDTMKYYKSKSYPRLGVRWCCVERRATFVFRSGTASSRRQRRGEAAQAAGGGKTGHRAGGETAWPGGE